MASKTRGTTEPNILDNISSWFTKSQKNNRPIDHLTHSGEYSSSEECSSSEVSDDSCESSCDCEYDKEAEVEQIAHFSSRNRGSRTAQNSTRTFGQYSLRPDPNKSTKFLESQTQTTKFVPKERTVTNQPAFNLKEKTIINPPAPTQIPLKEKTVINPPVDSGILEAAGSNEFEPSAPPKTVINTPLFRPSYFETPFKTTAAYKGQRNLYHTFSEGTGAIPKKKRTYSNNNNLHIDGPNLEKENTNDFKSDKETITEPEMSGEDSEDEFKKHLSHNIDRLDNFYKRLKRYVAENDCTREEAIEILVQEEKEKITRGEENSLKDLGNPRICKFLKSQRIDDNSITAELINVLGIQQQNQAMTLLQGIAPFSGHSSLKGTNAPRFDLWIRTFESVIGMAQFDEENKVRLLASKLISLAAETLDDFMRSHPVDEITYEAAKEYLMNRFHGAETREMYEKEYRSCARESGETILDYAHRLKRLFQHAYPLTDEQRAIPDVLTIRDQLLRDKFIAGLPIKLRERVKFKTFHSYEDLVKSATKYDVTLQEMNEERKKIEIVSRIAGFNKQDSSDNSELTSAINQLKEEIAELKVRNKPTTTQGINNGNKQELESERMPNFRQNLPSQQPRYTQNAQQNPFHYGTPQQSFSQYQNSGTIPFPRYQPPFFNQNNFQPFPFQPPQQNAPQSGQDNTYFQQTIICHRCKRPGHYARNCRTAPPGNSNPVMCFNCGRPNHLARDCRSRPTNYSENPRPEN
jgi:Zinc knuckle